jgi:hypothetical protein
MGGAAASSVSTASTRAIRARVAEVIEHHARRERTAQSFIDDPVILAGSLESLPVSTGRDATGPYPAAVLVDMDVRREPVGHQLLTISEAKDCHAR